MTRSGLATPDNHRSAIDNSEAHLRHAVEVSLRNLGVEHIDLYQLHRVDPRLPIEDTMGVLGRLQAEGKIRHIGLSAVSVDRLSELATSLARDALGSSACRE
jgi:pyridoxine 4-dehydrogenase